MERLTAYDWPGYVRALANVIERALILSAGTTLALGQEFARGAAGSSRIAPLPDRSLRRVEREHIEGVLAGGGWRVEGRGRRRKR